MMSVRDILTVMIIVAAVCTAFQYAFMASMSLLLLAPLPVLLLRRRLIRRRFIKSRMTFILMCLLAAATFYTGMFCGPLSAFVVNRNGWGMPETRLYVLKHLYRPLGTPIDAAMAYAPEWSRALLFRYSIAWRALGEEEEQTFAGVGRTIFILTAAIGSYFGYLGWRNAQRRQRRADEQAVDCPVLSEDIPSG